MELSSNEREIDYRYNLQDGLEVRFVWNSLLSLAYTKVHDHKRGDEFSAIAPMDVHPKETFIHPFMYRVEQDTQETIEFDRINE